MTTRLRHIALVSDNYALQGKFYEAAFGMRTAADPRPERAVTVSDGYVGLNINPRKPGRPAGLDHFGLEVDELEPVLERLRRYPEVQIVGRPHLRVRELAGREGEARLRLFERCCPLGSYRIADVDGVLLDITERK